MKHAQSQTEMPNLGADQITPKRIVAHGPQCPDLGSMLRTKLFKPDTPPTSPSSFRANTMKTQLRLLASRFYVMKPEALAELDKLASEGARFYDMIDVIDVDLEVFRALRWEYKWFDQLFNGLEDRAAYVRLSMDND